jgi:hypothetical protein
VRTDGTANEYYLINTIDNTSALPENIKVSGSSSKDEDVPIALGGADNTA